MTVYKAELSQIVYVTCFCDKTRFTYRHVILNKTLFRAAIEERNLQVRVSAFSLEYTTNLKIIIFYRNFLTKKNLLLFLWKDVLDFQREFLNFLGFYKTF